MVSAEQYAAVMSDMEEAYPDLFGPAPHLAFVASVYNVTIPRDSWNAPDLFEHFKGKEPKYQLVLHLVRE